MDEIKEISNCLRILRQGYDITHYGLEGDAVNILELLAKHQQLDNFEYVCKCISETPNESYRNVISYLLESVTNKNRLAANILNKEHIEILAKYKTS